MQPEEICRQLRSIMERVAEQDESQGVVFIPFSGTDVQAIGESERVIRRMFIPDSENFHVRDIASRQ